MEASHVFAVRVHGLDITQTARPGAIVQDYRDTALSGLTVANCLLHKFNYYYNLEEPKKSCNIKDIFETT